MQTLLPNDHGSAPRRHASAATGVLAALVMSLGIGGTTAAFTMANAMLPHSEPTPSCDIAAGYASGSMTMVRDIVYEPPVLGTRVSDMYGAGLDVASDGLESTLEAVGDGAGMAVMLLAGAASLALLVVCVRAARGMYDRNAGAMDRAGIARAAATTVGAVAVAAILLRGVSSSAFSELADAMPAFHLDTRAVVFALSVSALVEVRRRMAARLT